MTLVPLTECCLSLGVDPKTLRLWLKAAHLSCCLHPGDARLKCLTLSQLEQLAELHGRPLPSTRPVTAPQPVAVPSCAEAFREGHSPSGPSQDAAELRHHLSLLQQQVSTLQAQVTELALALLRASLAKSSQPTLSPAARLSPSAPTSSPVATTVASASAGVKTSAPRTVPPLGEPTRARSRALPLIQVRTDGSVVVIAPNEGVLALAPDSAQWFAWLAGIEAFSFESPTGRYSATRKFRHGQRVQAWNVHRSLHGRSCGLYLGLTPALTLARLLEMEARVRARLATH